MAPGMVRAPARDVRTSDESSSVGIQDNNFVIECPIRFSGDRDSIRVDRIIVIAAGAVVNVDYFTSLNW